MGQTPLVRKLSEADQIALGSWLFKFMVYVDIFWSSVIFGNADITISSTVGLAMEKSNPPWWARWLNAGLNRIQANHCQLAIHDDIIRAIAALKLLGER
jgi:hypothetical protein